MSKVTSRLFIALFFNIVFVANLKPAYATLVKDSLQTKGKWSLTNRINTGSMFFFTGVVWDHKPTFDTKIVFDKKGFGGLFFKSFELTGQQTAINYALIVLHKRFTIGERWMVSPQIGAQLNQNASLADKTSDFLINLTIAYKFANYFTISNDAVFQNLVFTKRENWTNRLKLGFQKSVLSASVNLWHRNTLLENPGYLSGGAEINYSGIKISPSMSLILGAQSISVFQHDTPRKSGFLISLGLAI